MKYFATLIITSFITFTSFAQNFEGEIVYQNTYKSKIPSLTDERFTSMMGATQEYFIKDGWYKSVSNGTLLQWQIYIPMDNKMYTKMSNNEAALWTDAAANSDSVISEVLNKAVIDILGYKCDELILQCKSGTQKYYFSSKLGIDSKLFINHKYGNWYAYVSRSNAVPLKMEIDNAQFTLTCTASKVQAQKLAASVFQLPAGISTSKSPY
jgi:hypothetical protein